VGAIRVMRQCRFRYEHGHQRIPEGRCARARGLGQGRYAASKAALRSFARTWAVDLKERGIRVNVVSPGTIITPAYKTLLSDEQIDAFAAQAAANAPLGRVGTADEIARAVVFLASEDSSFVDGAELFVDGGAAQI